MTPPEPTGSPIEQLLHVMRALRNPDGGCPWDLEQDFASIAPYTIEEAYEVVDAIHRGDLADLREELGDLLLQVVFHSQMASERGVFDFDAVALTIVEKMVRRHPHVFGDGEHRSADQQTTSWEAQKAEERAAKANGSEPPSFLDGVALALPALMRAEKLQKRAARAGFDWPDAGPVFDKLDEEIAEVREAMSDDNADAIEEEIGDLLFVVANLARKLKIDPEVALRRANAKFEHRFRAMERTANATGEAFESLDLAAQEDLWRAVKARGR